MDLNHFPRCTHLAVSSSICSGGGGPLRGPARNREEVGSDKLVHLGEASLGDGSPSGRMPADEGQPRNGV
eukprot:14811474-Alexandrium_andersonii.AAC.1